LEGTPRRGHSSKNLSEARGLRGETLGKVPNLKEKNFRIFRKFLGGNFGALPPFEGQGKWSENFFPPWTIWELPQGSTLWGLEGVPSSAERKRGKVSFPLSLVKGFFSGGGQKVPGQLRKPRGNFLGKLPKLDLLSFVGREGGGNPQRPWDVEKFGLEKRGPPSFLPEQKGIPYDGPRGTVRTVLGELNLRIPPGEAYGASESLFFAAVVFWWGGGPFLGVHDFGVRTVPSYVGVFWIFFLGGKFKRRVLVFLFSLRFLGVFSA